MLFLLFLEKGVLNSFHVYSCVVQLAKSRTSDVSKKWWWHGEVSWKMPLKPWNLHWFVWFFSCLKLLIFLIFSCKKRIDFKVRICRKKYWFQNQSYQYLILISRPNQKVFEKIDCNQYSMLRADLFPPFSKNDVLFGYPTPLKYIFKEGYSPPP